MSTDNLGKSLMNKLIAVPPFNAKDCSEATNGKTLINN
jgi:hypothetical protein